ncbi:Uncharacterised protein [Mycobacteroides abscessus subsp. abscessus]|nr:Uncharacterised protein [Mycobacteroides abscessus subsp. abscessus]
MLVEHLALELMHQGLVQLEDRRPRCPIQPIRPRVEPRGQDHHLLDAGLDCLAEVGIEVARAGALKAHEILAEVFRSQRMLGYTAGNQLGPFPTRGTTEHLGVLICRQRSRFRRLESPAGRHEQSGGADACVDVPVISIGAHDRDNTLRG